MFTGEFSIKTKGGKRTLKFGTLSFALFSEAEGIDLREISERISNPKPYTQINLIHSAAVAYCKINKKDPDFDLAEVSAWIDEVGEAPLADLIVQAMRTHVEKNRPAPIKAGQKRVGGGKKQ